MKKRYLVFVILFLFGVMLVLGPKVEAVDLDEIVNFAVTVEPRMNDGSLDITYDVTWKVLDDDTEGPLTWVQIGTPNSYFDMPQALTSNISSITKYNGAYVKINFKNKYYAGDQIKFKYKIHQTNMYKISWGNVEYSFTPA